jgi:hypothetical protein
MFILPAFFYFFIRYIQTHRIKFLITHILLSGAIIQFQMAVGIPLFMLSALALATQLLTTKYKSHLVLLALIIIPISSFIIFDLRHDHLLLNQVVHYVASPGRDKPNYLFLAKDRLRLALTSVELLRSDSGYKNFVIFGILLVFLYKQIQGRKYTQIYYYFLYFYFGFFVLSLINTGQLLYFYLFPLFPLVFLIFSSIVTGKHKKIFLLLFFFVFGLNEWNAMTDTQAAKGIIGVSDHSWKFLSHVAAAIYSGKDSTIGYFVYSPDVVAFEGKYVMKYMQTRYPQKTASYFQKKPVTYIVIAPPPRNNPYMQDTWWTVNQLHISSKPVSTIRFDNGYKIEKYVLTEAEIKISTEPNIDPGITFR